MSSGWGVNTLSTDCHFVHSLYCALVAQLLELQVANNVFGGGWYMQALRYDLKRTIICNFFTDEIVFTELFFFAILNNCGQIWRTWWQEVGGRGLCYIFLSVISNPPPPLPIAVNHGKFPKQEDSYAFEEDSSSESLSPEQHHSDESQGSACPSSEAVGSTPSSSSPALTSPRQVKHNHQNCSTSALEILLFSLVAALLLLLCLFCHPVVTKGTALSPWAGTQLNPRVGVKFLLPRPLPNLTALLPSPLTSQLQRPRPSAAHH